ncbi:MAG: CDP-alcohol phosphatidyltransferase family protein [Pseudodesulfovibrio sp.]|uniref:CDP-alcohol phosphatidyltransferase family protein n=1 Tax=Pseudodesulfovibrio sp. TaxID=2035812 RepID=UPI003D0D5ED1
MDYFNTDERDKQRSFSKVRDTVFSPLVSLLIKVGATPNQVSLAGVLFLILTSLLPASWPVAATVGMAFYVLCDGIDGPLARRAGKVHAGGALIDIVADQAGVVFLSAAAIYHFGAWGPAMVLFASSYMIFIGLALYANGLGVKLRRFLRCKYVFFLLYLGSLYLARDLVTWFCGAFAAYYVAETIEALRRIHRFHAREHRERTTGGTPAP